MSARKRTSAPDPGAILESDFDDEAPPSRAQRWRAAFVALVLLGLLGGLGRRLWQLQVVEAGKWKSIAERQQRPIIAVESSRGALRFGDQTAVASVRVRSAFCEPVHMGKAVLGMRERAPVTPEDLMDAAQRIARALGWSREREENLLEDMARPERAHFCWIERRMDDRLASALDQAKIAGVSFKTEHKRVYPLGSLGAHILGFVGLDKDGELYGMTGMETVLNKTLRGVNGARECVRDGARGMLLEEGRLEVPPIDGATVTLTIDPYVQQVCEEAAARAADKWHPLGIAIVVLRPRDGKILGLCSWPTYDPADPRTIKPESLMNRAISASFEPGSILKPLVAGYAVEKGAVSPTQHFDCTSPWKYRSHKPVTDVHNIGSDVPFETVISHSSNIGMSKIALALDGPGLVEVLGKCGFGRRTGLGLPLEEGGYTTPLRKWTYYSTISVAMGYEVTVTPVQMASAFAALGNGGVRMRPQIIERVEDAQGHVLRSFQPQVAERIVSEHVATDIMLPALKAVVEEGTAKGTKLDRWTMGGKTGTAMKVVGRGYQVGHYHASFCGFAPAEHPEILILATADDPQHPPHVTPYGGTVSAPMVKEIFEKILPYYKVPPSVQKGGAREEAPRDE